VERRHGLFSGSPAGDSQKMSCSAVSGCPVELAHPDVASGSA
jgi:hypothetical protein